MGTNRPARSHQKAFGVFYVRTRSRSPSFRNESKCSPHTTDLITSRKMSSGLNALPKGARMNDRKDSCTTFRSTPSAHGRCPGSIQVNDDADQRRVSAFSRALPTIEQATSQRSLSASWNTLIAPPPMPSIDAPPSHCPLVFHAQQIAVIAAIAPAALQYLADFSAIPS